MHYITYRLYIYSIFIYIYLNLIKLFINQKNSLEIYLKITFIN